MSFFSCLVKGPLIFFGALSLVTVPKSKSALWFRLGWLGPTWERTTQQSVFPELPFNLDLGCRKLFFPVGGGMLKLGFPEKV